jgi:hypothetical protein
MLHAACMSVKQQEMNNCYEMLHAACMSVKQQEMNNCFTTEVWVVTQLEPGMHETNSVGVDCIQKLRISKDTVEVQRGKHEPQSLNDARSQLKIERAE